MGLRFEWDPRKAATNLRRHGVSFEEATTVFGDPLSLTINDPEHSSDEARFVDVGRSHLGRRLVVSYTERAGWIRIITVRRAVGCEVRQYEEEPK